MRDLPRDPRSVPDVAEHRAAASSQPERFRKVLDHSLHALESGAALPACCTTRDPVRCAAEIEALAGARRLNTCRKDHK